MQLRIARHTDRLDAVVAFYRDGLGLEEVGGFRDHDGYDGVLEHAGVVEDVPGHEDVGVGMPPSPAGAASDITAIGRNAAVMKRDRGSCPPSPIYAGIASPTWTRYPKGA
jgi:catechol 2,3-dioxygenase-like lactoylglutathione lyase family enzyme